MITAITVVIISTSNINIIITIITTINIDSSQLSCSVPPLKKNSVYNIDTVLLQWWDRTRELGYGAGVCDCERGDFFGRPGERPSGQERRIGA